jgi:hypothetical protein
MHPISLADLSTSTTGGGSDPALAPKTCKLASLLGWRFRFNALMTPIRANIVGPPKVATKINASTAACHSAISCSAFGSFVM